MTASSPLPRLKTAWKALRRSGLRDFIKKSGSVFFDFGSNRLQPEARTAWGAMASGGSVLVASAALPSELNSEKRIKHEKLKRFHWKK